MQRVAASGRGLFQSSVALLSVCWMLAGALPAWGQAPNAAASPPLPQWPQEFVKDGTRLVIYQPQLRAWQRFRDLTCDTAIQITRGGGKAVMGVVSWHATTMADTQARIVAINDIVISDARFPSLDAAGATAVERLVRETYPGKGMTISLDRLLAGVQAGQTPARTARINIQPPGILVSTSPAILVFVDGEPIRVPVDGTKLDYVVNTNWDILYDKSDYYLLNQRMWLKARELSGPWTATSRLPPDMSKLPAGQNWDEVRKAVPPLSQMPAPRVFFATKPAELIVFGGEPSFRPIPNTTLAYADNSDNDIFRDNGDRRIYVLISGRWFRAPRLDGAWTYAGNDLPADFARIPANHVRARVLVSVPGTRAAQDAVLLAQVPTTAVVNRAEAEAMVKVAYAGEPQFKPIENTSLSYATNTSEKVIRYGDLYYLCFQGIWFVSTSARGPWETADSVPKAIYEIPPTSPVYNVTYVTVTNPTTTTVESSYTGGYVGMFVFGAAVGACIAYGTGYYYPPYYYWGPYPYPIYYPYPYTYGYRAVYNPATGFYGVGGAIYGPYGAAGRAAWYNPSTGFYGRAASVQTVYGGRTVAQAYNPWTGTYAATAQGHNAYAQWGSSVVTRGDDWARTGHVTTDQGTVARYRTSDGGSGTIIHGENGTGGVVRKDDSIYAGKDGNVYKRDSGGNWSKYDDGDWNPVDKPENRTGRQEGQGAASSQRAAEVSQRAQESGINRDSAVQAREAARQGTASAGSWSRGQSSLGQTQRRPSVPSETMQQLNRDASSRQWGSSREQMRSRNFSGAGARTAGARRR